MKIVLKFLSILIFLTSNSLSSEKNDLKYCSSKSIWKHSAYRGDKNKSYFENISSAIKSGYCGIEIDIIYDEDEKIIYISHDAINSSEKKKELSLNNIDKIIQNEKIYIWLDWKNTKLFQLPKGLKIIQNSTKGYLENKDSKIFIETPNILHNEFINFYNEKNNIYTLNWLSYSSDKNNLIESLKNIYRKIRAWTYICVLQNKWISSHDVKILQLCKNQRKAKSIFIFTINQKFRVEQIFQEGARVILSDTLK